VRLAKDTSNLFRDRKAHGGPRLDVRAFSGVLEVDPQQGWVDTEGMTPYNMLVDANLEKGRMPAVVPELKSITIGGAAAGVGIEATSFRQGLVHESLVEIEVLVGDGRVLVCTPSNEHRDLFYGFPNSYGTLGYAIRLRARTLPVKPYVRVEHHRHTDPKRFFADLQSRCAGDADFIDGIVFGPGELYINEARFTDEAPSVSDYSFEAIYYRSIRERSVDCLRTRDYIWRWDTDWFWCSKNIGAQNPLMRRLLGRGRLNFAFLHPGDAPEQPLGAVTAHRTADGFAFRVTYPGRGHPGPAGRRVSRLLRARGRHPSHLDLPHQGARSERLLRPVSPRSEGPIHQLRLLGRRSNASPHSPGHFNQLVEHKVSDLGGIKSLYSMSFFPHEEFWQIYGSDVYRELKSKYDPGGRFPDLYEKCVLGS
jgi:FAD/FMN-containing dehydrogenase